MNIIALAFGITMIVVAIIHNRQQQKSQRQENVALNIGSELEYNRAQ